MKRFVKKLSFYLAMCISIAPCSEAAKTRSKYHNLQLKRWAQQSLRYKMLINVSENNGIRKLLITVISPGIGCFENNYFESEAIKKFDWDPKWMLFYGNIFSQIDLYILPDNIKYKSSNLPIISCHRGSIVSNIYERTHPMWNFVNKYLSFWVKDWRNIKNKNRIGRF